MEKNGGDEGGRIHQNMPNPLLVSQSLVDSGFVSSNERVNKMVSVFWTDTRQTLKVIE